MNLQSLGEFGLIDLIDIPHSNPASVLLGIGDDCAVLPYSDTHYLLVSCDLLVEDVHFIRNRISPYQLGYKAVAVNLSDIAAMGGTPAHILVSAALPPDYTVTEWQELYRGIGAICSRYGVNVIGGDTTSSPDKLTINVTVLGFAAQQHLHLRRDANVGDAVFVTGPLGGSRAGLELVLHENLSLPKALHTELMRCHYQPEPCCDEIAALNEVAGEHLHALNDISDGLASECYEIAEASSCAVVLYQDRIPINAAASVLAEQIGADSLRWALNGGEDYQLLGTIDGAYAEQLCAQYAAITGKQITIIGRIAEGEGVYLLDTAVQDEETRLPDDRYLITKAGFNHFASDVENVADSTIENTIDNNVENTADEVVQLLMRQITALHGQIEAQRVYRHDLHNHLACVLGLLESSDVQAAHSYLRRMLDKVPKQDVRYHDRAVLNILLNQKATLAQEQHIEFQFHCAQNTAPENVSEAHLLSQISDYDLCALCGNLLDNGIEHNGGTDPYLYLDLFSDYAGNTVLRMENSCQTPPVLQEGIFVSCKADVASHGNGMKQIQHIAEQYGGTVSWQYDAEGERFITQCMFEKLENRV